ncbi:Mitochondrial import receptor subunit Tom22 [Cinara cedri]|uniref:Mitochondrial import receptor subunit TOM22 homolog n=1 Tax=Cinara cedri TaxID=506608 RepID=A0A5E4MIC4_9HEMI|nr:Mitochondrial import receptor subunit Tom22 [Cinara cedri]
MTTAKDLEVSDPDQVQLWSTDSGMDSMTDSNKDLTPIEENFEEDEEDETLGERLWALTEMFPDSVRSNTRKLINTTGKVIVDTYLFACTSTWYISTTAALLLMPVLFETERIQMEEAQKNHSKQLLLGPGGAGGNLGGGTTVLPN